MHNIDKYKKECPCLEKILVYNTETFETLYCYQHERYVVGIKQNDSTKVLTLNVPKELVARIIGKRGGNVKEMAKTLGVKRIEVNSL